MQVSAEDRSKWRYEVGGPPLNVAFELVEVLKSPNLLTRLEEVRAQVTTASWPSWETQIRKGLSPQWLLQFTHWSQTVRYPADGMAYVSCPVTHPDETEGFIVEKAMPMWANIVTLILEDGEWRVHQLGEMCLPAAVGKQAYSW